MTTLTPEQIEQVKEKFHRYDKNGDGKVTVEEFEAAVGQYLTPEDFAILLEQLNPDHDDEISYEELLAEREREYVANREVDDVERGEDTSDVDPFPGDQLWGAREIGEHDVYC